MASPSVILEDYLSAIGEDDKEETDKVSTTEQDTWDDDTDNPEAGHKFDPVAPSSKPLVQEEAFPDENDEGPNAFVYYTVPQTVKAAFDKDVKESDYANVNAQSNLTVEGELGPREKQVYRYFRRRLIMDLLNFLLCHLLAHEPDDPIEFLLGILDNCLLFRSGHIEHPPTLFEQHNLEAMFRTFDPSKTGFITYDQYLIAMKTLMVRNFDDAPKREGGQGLIKKEVFVKNARMALTNSLLDFIVIPQVVTSSSESEDIGKDATAVRLIKGPSESRKAHKYMKQILRDSKASGKLFGRPAAAAATTTTPDIVFIREGPSEEIIRSSSRPFGVRINPLKSMKEAFRPPSE